MREESELLKQITRSYDATTIAVRRRLGMSDMPKIKVGYQLSYPDGPPKEWVD